MKNKVSISRLLCLILFVMCPPADMFGQTGQTAEYRYMVTNGAVIINLYLGSSDTVVVPDKINGLPVVEIGALAFSLRDDVCNIVIPDSVTRINVNAFAYNKNLASVTLGNGVVVIEDNAFKSCPKLTSIVIPDSVTYIGNRAFTHCGLTNVVIGAKVSGIGIAAFGVYNLTSVYFRGNAPSQAAFFVFGGNNENTTVYYLAGTTGWESTFQECPTALWQLPALNGLTGIGMVENQGFGFSITGTNGQVVIVEACTNLASCSWFPVQTNTLVYGVFNFTDPQWFNYSSRLYRVRSP